MSERRPIIWEKVRGPRALTAFWTATALGAGLFPWGPGTAGSLVAVPLAYWINAYGPLEKGVLWIALLIFGTWAAQVFDQLMGSADNQNIVIDEVVGLGITAWTAGRDPKALFAAFILFRLFDITKPPPVRYIDRWSKNRPAWSGFGVMADDVVAGFQGLAVMVLLQHFGFF